MTAYLRRLKTKLQSKSISRHENFQYVEPCLNSLDLVNKKQSITHSQWAHVNDTLRMYKNDDIRMYNFNCITDTIVEVITTCNTYTLLTVHLL